MSNVTLDRAHCVETIISLSGLRSFELDKESESRLLQAFNSPVPRGTYLADYLDGAAEAFESAIRSDIVMPFASSIRETRRELDESAKQLAALKQQIKAEEEKLRVIRRDVDYAKPRRGTLSTRSPTSPRVRSSPTFAPIPSVRPRRPTLASPPTA